MLIPEPLREEEVEELEIKLNLGIRQEEGEYF